MGALKDRFLDWIATLGRRGPNDWVFPQASDPAKPMWDSGIRKAIHDAAKDAGCDFPGLGPHSFRRANLTWRQEVGGSAVEASKIAGQVLISRHQVPVSVQLQRERAARLVRVAQGDLFCIVGNAL